METATKEWLLTVWRKVQRSEIKPKWHENAFNVCKKKMQPFFESRNKWTVDLSKIRDPDIDAYISHLSAGKVSPQRINHALRFLDQIYDYSVKQGYIGSDLLP